MAKLAYTRITAGTEMGIFDDPVVYTKADDDARVAEVLAIQAAGTTVRTLLAACNGQELVDFDAALQDEWDIVTDRLDYYDYETTTINITEQEGAWFSPIAVEDFGSEDPTFPASNSIDGDLASQWRHETLDETHFLIWELRAHPKKVTKMRFRYGAGENIRERLTNITIKASKALSKIDDANSIVDTAVIPVWPVAQGNTWLEIVWPSPKARVRFVKIEFETEHGNNQARIREVEMRVITRRPQEV